MLTSLQDHWRIKRQEFESWSEKTRNFFLDQSEAEEEKVVLKQNFHKTLVVRVGGWRVAVGRLGETSRLGQLDRLGG